MEMIDIIETPRPMHHLEILTLDNSLNNVLFRTVYNPATCMHAFPRNFVGRIYTDGGSLGTGFIYYSPTGIPYVISAKHVATNPLSINLRYFFYMF